MTKLDPAAAADVQYSTDPRIRHLAEAMWRMQTGGSRMDWLYLGKNNPEALISEAREWVRAAVAAGIIPPPSSDPAWKNAAHTAANADDTQACGAREPEPRTGTSPCVLPAGHDGRHQDKWTNQWPATHRELAAAEQEAQ